MFLTNKRIFIMIFQSLAFSLRFFLIIFNLFELNCVQFVAGEIPVSASLNEISNYHIRESDDKTEVETKLICFYIFTDDFDSSIIKGLCTHIIVGFFGINNETYSIDDCPKKFKILKQITSLKKTDEKLKVLMSVGGAGFEGFSLVVTKHITRKKFIKSVVEAIKSSNADGIDIDWEWPAMNGNPEEKIKFIQLLYEFRQEFARHKNRYIISVDVSSLKLITELSYKVQYLAQYVDFVNIMCYDYHFFTKWYPLTGHNAPLYSSVFDSLFFNYNTNYSIYFWISQLMPKEKIVLGIPTFGHTYRLSSPEKHGLRAPAVGSGSIGNDGFVTYPQVCEFIKKQNATVVFDDNSKVPYAYKFPNWVSYDNEMSLMFKAGFVQDLQLSGIMVFSINADDFSGSCQESGQTFPLLRKVRSILFNEI